MNSVKSTAGGFEKAVFNAVRATYPGGVTIDKTGYVNADGVIPAGTLISRPDAATGLSKVVTITPADEGTGTPASFDVEPLGLLYKTIPLDDEPMGGVVTDGDVKEFCLPDSEQASAVDIHTKIPTLIMTI